MFLLDIGFATLLLQAKQSESGNVSKNLENSQNDKEVGQTDDSNSDNGVPLYRLQLFLRGAVKFWKENLLGNNQGFAIEPVISIVIKVTFATVIAHV
ncbi:hypothetical protein RN001_013321 [Aquatica leii]|uniref:Uncharacterized protein n=1 Tax=Aquatica leii TaxID=1421715 RepID=A0AAN7S6Y3_9COLE|nr:hypothetical protein RN001_013321 [Aquatica leii]